MLLGAVAEAEGLQQYIKVLQAHPFAQGLVSRRASSARQWDAGQRGVPPFPWKPHPES